MRVNRNPNLRLQLGEISRRSAELSAISSKLEEMASQLDRLRRLNGQIEFLSYRNCDPSRKHDHRTYRHIGNSRERT